MPIRTLALDGRTMQIGRLEDFDTGTPDPSVREAFYHWRIIPRMLVDTNVRDLSGESCSCRGGVSTDYRSQPLWPSHSCAYPVRTHRDQQALRRRG